MDETQKEFQELALQQAIKLLKKQKLTSKDFRKLSILTKIIFDVNSYNIQILSDRLSKIRSFGAAHSGLTSH